MPEKILIVDDDLDGLKLISLMLQRHGYEVITANAGNQAILRATNERPDLIILDVMMPDINGYEVCRRLRASSVTQSIPIIMFTAKNMIDDKVAGFEAGADDYLTKPTHPAELASRVKAILQRSAKQRNKPVDRGLTIGVVGVKGGIGTTTVTLNLGAAFRKMEENPIVADIRLGNGSLALLLGITRTNSMLSVLNRTPQEVTSAVLERELITHATGLRLLLSSYSAKEALLNYSLETMLAMVGGLRTLGKPVILDLGSGYTRTLQRLQNELDRIIVLLEPTNLALVMAREMLQEFGGETRSKVHIVVINRQQNSLQPAWHQVEKALGHEIRAIISPAPDLAYQAAEAGIPMVYYQSNAIVSSQFHKLAEYMHSGSRLPADGRFTN
ncbi:MAG: response regulator [Anaerolineae bacterium]